MPKSRKRRPRKPPHHRGGARRGTPLASTDVLREITPYPPELVLERGVLTHSPAATYLGLAKDGASPGAIELIERWPFHIARAGQQPGNLVCLAMIAHEQGLSIAAAAAATVELEDSRLLVWSSEHKLYVMSPEVAGVNGSSAGLARVDEVFARINAETPEQRSARRWAQPTVVARPADKDGSCRDAARIALARAGFFVHMSRFRGVLKSRSSSPVQTGIT